VTVTTLGTTLGAPRVSVVVPTYNEAKNLPHVFGLLPEGLHEVIVVDGRSTDGTIEAALLLRPEVKIVRQTRRGKGNALACGFAAVTGDIVVMLDADGSADPREIPAYVAALVGGADFANNAFWVHCLDVLELEPGSAADVMHWGDGFEIETVINTRIAKAKLTIAEVKSFEFNRIHGTSNLHAVTDGLRVLKAICIERFTKPAVRPELSPQQQTLQAA
jgi:glycosyltransferase involved in cell wall biosynthesis